MCSLVDTPGYPAYAGYQFTSRWAGRLAGAILLEGVARAKALLIAGSAKATGQGATHAKPIPIDARGSVVSYKFDGSDILVGNFVEPECLLHSPITIPIDFKLGPDGEMPHLVCTCEPTQD